MGKKMMAGKKVTTSIRRLIAESRFTDRSQCQYDWTSAMSLKLVGFLLTQFFFYLERDHTLHDVANYPKFCLGTITTSEDINGKKVLVKGHQKLMTLLMILITLQGRKDIVSNRTDDSEPQTWYYGENGCYCLDEFATIFETIYFGKNSTGKEISSTRFCRNCCEIDIVLRYPINNRSHPLFVHWLLDVVTVNEVKI